MGRDFELFGRTFTWRQIGVLAAVVILPLPAAYLVYSGLCSRVKRVVCRRPAYGKMRIAYKLRQGGEYCTRGGDDVFEEARSIQPGLKTIGIYYDDPDKVAVGNLRSIFGVILCEGDESCDEELERKFASSGFSFITLPEVAAAVQTSFPITTNISYGVASWKVYPKLDKYIQDNKLRWNPAVEVYEEDCVTFMIPQSDGEKFCVPGVEYQG